LLKNPFPAKEIELLSPPFPIDISQTAKYIELTLQLHKNYMKREVGVLKNLYTCLRVAPPPEALRFSSIWQRSPQVTSYVTH